jgi:hypothetical protein
MTKGELVKFLEQFPDDYQVIMATDQEGNGFFRLDEIVSGFYSKEDLDPEIGWDGEIVLLDEEELEPGEDFNCVVLWPGY